MVYSWGFEDVVFEDEDWPISDVPYPFLSVDKDKDGYTWEALKSDLYAILIIAAYLAYSL